MSNGANEQVDKKPSEMKKEDLPKTRAFQDKFTRTFLTSTKEVKEGYYSFESKSKKYTMSFPSGGQIPQTDYERNEDSYEFIYGEVEYKSNSIGIIRLMYDESTTNSSVNMELSSLKRKVKSEKNFNKREFDKNEIYWMPIGQGKNSYTYAGYAHPKNGSGSIELIYSEDCNNYGKLCENFSAKSAQKHFEDILLSIKFQYKEKGN
ncbi:hypothetical protein [Priestia koreensis]|uniref:hypothetical protein n=1 Tax=Priestia koreensis TaxID=284581 RepID=UPI003016F815